MDNKSAYLSRPWLKFYPEGVPSDVDIPSDMTLGRAFDEAVEKWKDKTALIYYGAKMSFTELKEQVDRFTTALHDLGIKKGDTVAFNLLNCPQFIIAYFACHKLGAIVTPISPFYVSKEIKYQLEDSGAETIVCQDILWEPVEKAHAKSLKRVILTDISAYLPRAKRFMGKSIFKAVYKKVEAPSLKISKREGFYRFEELIKKYPPNPPAVEVDPNDVAILPYTTGTTGNPKGVMLTHSSMYANIFLFKIWWTVLEDGKETTIGYMPLYHVAGQGLIMLQALFRGFTLVTFTTADPDDILSAIQQHHVTVFFGAPSIYNVFKDHDKTDRVDWKKLKFVLTGADSSLEDTREAWEKRTGVRLVEAYGQTESSVGTIVNPLERIKPGSLGIPVSSTSAAIVDPDTGEFLPVREIGELIIKSPTLAKGYQNLPEETERAFIKIDSDRWFKTGDLVSMDEDGYFYFYDRVKDRIKHKGHSISAREIEEVIALHPKVKEVGIVGVPDPKVGEQIKACVVAEVEARGKLSEEEIIKWCEESLADFKVPNMVEFRGEVPKTDVGKVSRRELREEELE